MRTLKRAGFTLVEIMLVIAILAVVIAIAVPNIIAARKNANEAGAIEGLRSIITAQTMYREADADRNTIPDYGNLAKLGQFQQIDSILGSGSKHGYVFRCAPSAASAEVLWFATANPILPIHTGDRYFCCNHSGTIFYTTTASFSLNTATSCAIPSNAQPIGK